MKNVRIKLELEVNAYQGEMYMLVIFRDLNGPLEIYVPETQNRQQYRFFAAFSVFKNMIQSNLDCSVRCLIPNLKN